MVTSIDPNISGPWNLKFLKQVSEAEGISSAPLRGAS